MRRGAFVTQLALGAMILGPATLLVLDGMTGEVGDGWWSGSVTAVAEALLIAGILGVTVDRILKTVLVRDVARLALGTIFGANAPQEYVNELQACLQAIQLVHLRQDWMVTLDWHERDAVLAVTVEGNLDSVNVSSTVCKPDNAWITHSTHPTLLSRIDGYRITVRTASHGNRADTIESRRLTPDELARAMVSLPDGSVRAMTSKLALPSVPPGARRHLTISGVTYQAVVAGLPLVAGVPCLSTTVQVGGTALDDLSISLRLSSAKGALTGQECSTSGNHLFSHGFTLPGATFLLQWAMKEPPSGS